MTLPVTAIFPIYECADHLARHLESVQEWLDLVEEVIVVDSGSLDGSAELARREIIHPKVRHEVVPPGLYAAWNHGIRLAGSEFCYISTVGDSIRREGLQHLVSTAQGLDVDVMISPPRCITEEGEQADFRIFPVHSIVSGSSLGEPLRIEPWLSYLMATGFSIESFLGSSASNLYRTDCLKQEPFPTDFGKAGDSAWFRSNSLRFKFAVTPRVCADFLLHQDHASRPHGEISELLGRLTTLSDKALREWSKSELPEKTSVLRILQCWREVAGVSPEKMLDAVRHLEGVAATAVQQREYIEELKDHLDKRAVIIQELTVECERLRSIPPSASSSVGFFASLRKKLRSR